jgi:PII-like signaling protein
MATETTIDGIRLVFYSHVHAKHEGKLVSEYLLELAKREKFGGGSVFRAVAGFGRHGVLHEEQFFELADDLPVKVEFLLTTANAESMLRRVRDAGVDVVYARTATSFGLVGNS